MSGRFVGLHYAHFVLKRPWLTKLFKPVVNWYMDAAGYRKMGLFYDDLISEENPVVQKALKRLPPHEAYDRVFRLRRAFGCTMTHRLLPADEQTKPSEDRMYLTPIIEEIEREIAERKKLDGMTLKSSARNGNGNGASVGAAKPAH